MNCAPIRESIMGKIEFDTNGGCWLWSRRVGTDGYAKLVLYPEKKDCSVHRLVWNDTNGDIPRNMLVLHKCDIRVCVNPEHLFLGTQQENVDDMRRKGRHAPRGILQPPRDNGPPAMAVAFLTRVLRGDELPPSIGMEDRTRVYCKRKGYVEFVGSPKRWVVTDAGRSVLPAPTQAEEPRP